MQRSALVTLASLMLATSPWAAFAQDGPDNPTEPFDIEARIDTSDPDNIVLETDEIALDRLLDLLGRDVGFRFRNRTGVAMEEVVTVAISGRDLDIVRWLLRDFNYALATNEETGRLERVIVLARIRDASTSGRQAIRVDNALLAAYEAERETTPVANRDYREWLEARITAGEGDILPPVDPADLYDLPESLEDRMTRRLDPLDGDYNAYRLRVGPNNSQPRHLSAGNNAAGHDVESALRRTTLSAVSGVRDLTDAIDGMCATPDCSPQPSDDAE